MKLKLTPAYDYVIVQSSIRIIILHKNDPISTHNSNVLFTVKLRH